MEPLAQRLRWLRAQHHMTLRDVQEQSGVSISFISDLERGRTVPSLAVMERLARVYHLSLGEALVNVTVLDDEEEEVSR